jgi:hypothetical protein
MASAPGGNLPLLFNQLTPLSSSEHGDWRFKPLTSLGFLKGVHAIPLTVDEFVDAQRHYPIVFSAGPDPVPLALMGLNEGVNVFINEDGSLSADVYLPAYVRRYPFMLARLRPDTDDLSLCFDPSSGGLGAFEEGDMLFEEGQQPSDHTKAILGFCEQFEQAGQRTGAFMKELKDNKLLMDGEVTVQPEGAQQPYVYRGFQMIDEQKLRDLRGDITRKMIQSGLLPLLFAHLFSLALIRNIFGRQMAMGLVPAQVSAPQA